MYYLVNVNNITIVKNNGDMYNFLDEMYFPLFELYCKKYFLQNISTESNNMKQLKIKRIDTEINRRLLVYNLPENFVFEKTKDKYKELFSGIDFDLVENDQFNLVSEEYVLNYLKNRKDNCEDVINNMKKFNKIINDKQKRK